LSSDSHAKSPRQTALKLLAARSLSFAELRDKLLQRGFAQPKVQSLLNDFGKLGYLDDEKLCENFILLRLERKPYGQNWFRVRLRRRGIDRETVERVVERVYQRIDEYQLAYRAAEEVVRRAGDMAPERLLGRLARFLKNRGFNDAIIAKVLHDRLAQGSGAEYVDVG